jgi:hypothetical protein
MRRLILPVLALFLLLVPAACKRHRKPAQATSGTAASALPATLLSMADPKASVQLIRGFYDIEEGNWRWTARLFSVILHPPETGKVRGATLTMRLSIPPVVVEKLKKVTLAAVVGGIQLAPETYSTVGNYSYTRDVPSTVLGPDSVTVDFTLDKAIPPNGADQRELGIVVQAVGFEAK